MATPISTIGLSATPGDDRHFGDEHHSNLPSTLSGPGDLSRGFGDLARNGLKILIVALAGLAVYQLAIAVAAPGQAVGTAVGDVVEGRLEAALAQSEATGGEVSAQTADTADFDQLNSAEYAGITFAVVETRAVPENRSGHPIIVVELAALNQRPTQARVPAQMVSLDYNRSHPDGGAPIPVNRFEYTPHTERLVMEAGEATQATVVFRLPPLLPAHLEDFTLVIGESGRIPIELPLVGQPTAHTGRQALTSSADLGVAVGDVAMSVTEAYSDLHHGSYRVQDGKRLVVTTVAIEAQPRARGALDMAGQRSSWTLHHAGGELSPVRLETLSSSADGWVRTNQVQMVFETPAGLDEFDLFVGFDDDRVRVAGFDTYAAG